MTQNHDRDPRTYAIIGAAFEVHKTLGGGFLEVAYGDALAVEFAARAIPFDRERELPILYKGRRLPTVYRADFLCYGGVIVEIKGGRFERYSVWCTCLNVHEAEADVRRAVAARHDDQGRRQNDGRYETSGERHKEI